MTNKNFRRVLALWLVVTVCLGGLLLYQANHYQSAVEAGLPQLIKQARQDTDVAYNRARALRPFDDNLAHRALQAKDEVYWAETAQRSGDHKAAFKHVADAWKQARWVQNILDCNGDDECSKYGGGNQ